MPPSGIALGGCASLGHGLSLLEKTTLRGLRTRAIPAGQGTLRQHSHRTKKIGLYFRGVTARRSPGLVKLCITSLAIAQVVSDSNPLTSSGKYTETSAGREA